MRIKILHILHSLRIGGLENGVVNLINHLDNNRFEHTICCIDSSGPMAERISRRNINIYELKKKGRDYFLPLKLTELIRRIEPDIVHTRNWSAIDGVIGAKLAGVKNIIHGEHGREAKDPTGKNNVRKKVRKLLNPWISRFVIVSAELRNWLVHDVGIPDRKIIQIINGVDTEKFRPAENKGCLKSKLGFAPRSFLIGTVGRLDTVKDQKTLIRAFRCLIGRIKGTNINSNPQKILLIIGAGPEEQNLKTLVQELGIKNDVYFFGERYDIHELLQSMDVFILSSIAEGISNTILEAMACGLPVVTTKVGGNIELVEDGQTGFLFTPGDYQGLAERIVLYSEKSSLLQEHGLNGMMRAQGKFSLSTMVQKYAELYNSLSI